MQATTFHLQAAHCGVSGDDSPPDLASGLTSHANGVLGNLTINKGTGAVAGTGTDGAFPSEGGASAQSDNDDDSTGSSSDDEEDTEITAMKEEMIRYVIRGPANPPSNSHGYSVVRNSRPPAQSTGGTTSKPRPSAVTLGPGTTAKPKPPKK